MQAPPKMGQGAAASKEGALIGFTDSPKKKLENARAQKVTNFKLGHSGKESDYLKIIRAPSSSFRETCRLPEPGRGDLQELQSISTSPAKQHWTV